MSYMFQELVASNPEPRNWKGIVISILCILFVILLVMASVVWMTPPDPGPRVKGERIRLETILDGKFKPNTFNASWFEGTVLQSIFINRAFPLAAHSAAVIIRSIVSVFAYLRSHLC